MIWGATVRERLLTQHFSSGSWRTTCFPGRRSPRRDRDGVRRPSTLGLFLSVFISLKFLFMPFPSPGRTAVLAVGDRLVFVTLAMIVLAFVAVATWDALSLDPGHRYSRTAADRARGARPAKLRAIAILAGGFSLVASVLERVPSHVDGRQAAGRHHPGLTLVVVHLLITLSAGLFGFAVAGGAGTAARHAGLALHTSPPLQAALIVILVTSLLLQPY